MFLLVIVGLMGGALAILVLSPYGILAALLGAPFGASLAAGIAGVVLAVCGARRAAARSHRAKPQSRLVRGASAPPVRAASLDR